MNNNILLIISLVALANLKFSNSFSQKDDCEKYFMKEKHSSKESDVFKNTLIKTKSCFLYTHMQRQVLISFIKDGDRKRLCFNSWFSGSGNITNKIILGQNIRIALVFDNGTNEIINFDSNEQSSKNTNYSGGISGGQDNTFNYIELSDSLLNRLIKENVIKIEMQNPFGSLNESKVISEDLGKKQTEALKQIANCFYNKLNN